MRGMLYFGECRQTFRRMSSIIPGNFVKHSGECRQTFWGLSPNIPENILKGGRKVSLRLHRICTAWNSSWSLKWKQLKLDWLSRAVGDWTGSNRTEKGRVCVLLYLLDLFGEKWGREVVV